MSRALKALDAAIEKAEQYAQLVEERGADASETEEEHETRIAEEISFVSGLKRARKIVARAQKPRRKS